MINNRKSHQTLSVALTNPASDAGDYILIEQEKWGKDVGRTSVAQGVYAIGSMIFGGSMPDANCGGLNGFDTDVYVYPSSSDLRFQFAVSHGEFQPGTFENLIREEIIQCSLQDSVQCKYPVQSMVSMQWLGECFNSEGIVVSRPTVKRSGRTFSFSEKVYGSLKIRYNVRRFTYKVRIEEREDSIENNFECVAYCVWDDGVAYKEITAPSGYEMTSGNCGNGLYGTDGLGGGAGGATDIDPGEPDQGDDLPTAPKKDRKVSVDYCEQTLESDSAQ